MSVRNNLKIKYYPSPVMRLEDTKMPMLVYFLLNIVMKLFGRCVIILTPVFVVLSGKVLSVEVVKADPGENITVTWNIGSVKTWDVKRVTIEHNINDTLSTIVNCTYIIYCLDSLLRKHVSLMTVPPINLSNINNYYITDIGVYITNVSQSDAGIYRFEYTFPDQLRRSELLLYLFQAPAKPVISQRISTNDVILTCNSMSQSLPEQYRTNSWMGYNWKVTSSLEVYVTEGNQVRIKRPWKSCHLFECWSREENSTLTSPTTRYLGNDVRFYDESVVILLGVFLLLAIGVAVVVGVVAFLQRRRLKREMAKFQQNNRNLVDFSRERRQPFYHKDVPSLYHRQRANCVTKNPDRPWICLIRKS